MENTNKMRIICNPFKKELEYQWYDSNTGDYVELDSENSALTRDEFLKTTIQSRAHEIVGKINEECNVGNIGLEISFIGTEDDYNDFCGVIKKDYEKANIKCIQDKHFFNAASEVMPKIRDKFADIESTLGKYTDTKLICKYKDVVKPSISLCVMGMYSAGKSAFINSLIGEEILPSASEPTTAKVYKIYCDEKYQIRFWFDGSECLLTFEGETYNSNSNGDMEIIEEFQSIVESEGLHHNEVTHMSEVLGIINKYNKDNKISDIIEVRIPFKKTNLPVEEFEFIIYDTPGSNSGSNDQHLEILKGSLDEQTNALPIVLTTPDTMDAKDNHELLKLIKDQGSSLDERNTIIIINKADEKGKKALEGKREKCNDLVITKWKSTRIFFVSSVIGIASKKDNPDNEDEWLDENMYEIYDEKKEKYSSDKRKLFEYNIIDKSRIDETSEYSDNKKTTHLYKNSGLESVEREIVEYARKYALYNKCQQASEYLKEAIDLCIKNIQKAEDERKNALKEAEDHFSSKEKKLCQQLEDKKKETTTYNTEFHELMRVEFDNYKKRCCLSDDAKAKKALRKEWKNEWKNLKIIDKIFKMDENGIFSNDAKAKEALRKEWKNLKIIDKIFKMDENWIFSEIKKFSDDKYNNFLKTFSENANERMNSFWNEKSELFKKECKKIVHDSDAFTKEQKEILERIVLSKVNMSMYRMEFDLRQMGAIRHKKILIWDRKVEKFDIKECCNQLVEQFDCEVRKRIVDLEIRHSRNFNIWIDSLIGTLKEKLCEFNSDLYRSKQKIDKLKEEIDKNKDCERILTESKNYIDGLLEEQGGDDIA